MNKRIDEVMTKENIVTTEPGTDMETASRFCRKTKLKTSGCRQGWKADWSDYL